MCASTCAQFVLRMHYYKKASFLTHGGIVGQDMPFFALPGGDVYEWNQVAQGAKRTKLPVLSTTGVFRFNFNEMYIGNEQTPAEFQRFYGQFHTYMWDSVFNTDINTVNALITLERLYATGNTLWNYIPVRTRNNL